MVMILESKRSKFDLIGCGKKKVYQKVFFYIDCGKSMVKRVEDMMVKMVT